MSGYVGAYSRCPMCGKDYAIVGVKAHDGTNFWCYACEKEKPKWTLSDYDAAIKSMSEKPVGSVCTLTYATEPKASMLPKEKVYKILIPNALPHYNLADQWKRDNG